MDLLRSTHTRAGTSDGHAITKIITGAILALLMVLSAWTACHAESDAVVSTASAAVTGQTSVTDPPTTAEFSSSVSMVLAGDGGGATLGLAACLLGSLCGLALAVFFLRLLRGQTPSVLSISRACPTHVSCTHARARVAVTLTELSISRT